MLSEVDLDELGQRRRLREPLLAAQLLEHTLERLRRSLLGREPATLDAT